MSSEKESDLNDLQHLKQVSKIKHIILEKYLPAWAEILGSWNNRLCYFDCYAGPGIYESGGKRKEGSPIIAVKIAKKYLSRYRLREITITLIEKEGKQRASLKKALEKLKPYEKGLQ
ncbi:MAG: three-Cys-motif partner protein TcmP, partial [Nitrospinales bacterium]